MSIKPECMFSFHIFGCGNFLSC
uniref:Uncharacterized protein n=1 Tax=Arundo donax TaxID=35708 RepID=A0A0A9H997_ARUDO